MNIKFETKTVNVKDLNIHPFLKKYGIIELSDFEIQQLNRFNLPIGEVLITSDSHVLCNWEAVEEARRRGIDKIEVTVLIGVNKDMLIQVISVKKMRQYLSRMRQAELIVELSNYLTENPEGKKWCKDIPGKSTNEKVGALIGYSYGMVYQTREIYKYCPDLLAQIDKGNMTFTSAIAEVQKQKDKLTPPKAFEPTETDQEDTPIENVVPCETLVTGTNAEQPVPVLVPTKVNCDPAKEQSKWRYAGEQHMVECEPISGITITYPSGKKLELAVNGNIATGTIDGTAIKQLEYFGKTHERDNSEIHHMTTDKERIMIELILTNTDKIAA